MSEEEEDSEGASSSTEEDGGPVRVLGNQLLAEVHIEQPTVQRSESPTFARVGDSRRVTINVVDEDGTASRDMEDSNSHDEEEVNDDSNDNEDRRSNSNTVVV